MSEPFLAEIKLFAGNFAPRGWAFCDGQILPISQYSALFSLMGTFYGGDGRTTFALPDLRGRVPVSPGSGPGLSSYPVGARGGSETHSHTVNGILDSAQEPHTHELPGSTAGAGVTSTTVATVESTSLSAAPTQPSDNRPPYLAVHYIIALEGIFPSRS